MAELPAWTAGAGGGASKAEVAAVAGQVVGGDLKGNMPTPTVAATIARKSEVETKLEVGGGTMTGTLILDGVPVIARKSGGPNPFVAKPSTDENEGLLNYINDSPVGYLDHYTLGPNSTRSTAALGIGMDNGQGRGIILANKKEGQGLALENRASITSNEAYGFVGFQKSALAPLIRLELQTEAGSAGADLLQLVSSVVPDATTRLLRVQDPTGNTAASIFALDGHIDLRRSAVIADRADKAEVSFLTFEDNSAVPAAEKNQMRLHKQGIQLYTYSGSVGKFWPMRIEASGSTFKLQGGNTTEALWGGELKTILSFSYSGGIPKLSFFGAAPAARPNVAAAAAVTAKELCEALETLGLIE
jgi:hypothetical protein